MRTLREAFMSTAGSLESSLVSPGISGLSVMFSDMVSSPPVLENNYHEQEWSNDRSFTWIEILALSNMTGVDEEHMEPDITPSSSQDKLLETPGAGLDPDLPLCSAQAKLLETPGAGVDLKLC